MTIDIGDNFFTLRDRLDTIPAASQTRAANLSCFQQVVTRCGGDSRAILEANGINPNVLRHPESFVDCTSYIGVLQYCADHLNADLFGLYLADAQDFDVFGPLDTLCRTAADFGSALRAFCDYIPIVQTPECEFELHLTDELAELRWGMRNDFGPYDQVNHKSALLLVRFLSSLCEGVVPSHVAITTAIPEHVQDEAQTIIGCTVHSSQPVDLVAFRREHLGRPLPTADSVTFGLLQRYLENLRGSEARSISERVRDHVRGSMMDGGCTLERCAERLDLSAKQLRSRLAREGASFSGILARERIARAETCLLDGTLSIDEIALLLGYSESTSFGRAFRRWTGMSPAEFRRTQRRAIA
jgi:AraC-like DNA-binding protein